MDGQMPKERGRTFARSSLNLGLDLLLGGTFVVLLRPFTTGLAVHEWVGLAMGVALAAHALLHRKWISGVSRQLLAGVPNSTLVWYLLDLWMLISFAAIILTGAAMSYVVLPSLGITTSWSEVLGFWHKVASYATLGLLAVKLVLHQSWISGMARRVLLHRERGAASLADHSTAATHPEGKGIRA
jgi:hypothetical protein